jgi:CheY-like chemotaxis protein
MSLPHQSVKPTSGEPGAARILIVDDSETMRLYLATILRTLGFQVTEAADGHAAFERVMAAEYDLVISDLDMRPMSGYELIAALGLLPAWRRPRMIVCSATEVAPEKLKNELRRVSHVLTKPVSLHDIAHAVQEALWGGKVCGRA